MFRKMQKNTDDLVYTDEQAPKTREKRSPRIGALIAALAVMAAAVLGVTTLGIALRTGRRATRKRDLWRRRNPMKKPWQSSMICETTGTAGRRRSSFGTSRRSTTMRWSCCISSDTRKPRRSSAPWGTTPTAPRWQPAV